jgi:L-asparaginase II
MLHIEQTRGGLVETVHPVSAIVHDGTRALWSAGPSISTFWRSSCKPFQLLTSLEQLGADVVDALAPEDLAVGAASHSGQAHHVSRVTALLARFELGADGLRCGAHAPTHDGSRTALLVAGQTPSTLHNNCSGKHTFMLAAARARGWDADYLPAEHPLQQANAAALRVWGGADLTHAVDGCGVPTFHAPLESMARAFAGLARAMEEPGALLGRIGRAMADHPEYVSGDNRLDLAVTRGATEPLACKIGAEGLFCIALPRRGIGVAVKCHTGQDAPLAVAVRAVLEMVAPGVLPAPTWHWSVVKNVAGRVVGERRAVWSGAAA